MKLGSKITVKNVPRVYVTNKLWFSMSFLQKGENTTCTNRCRTKYTIWKHLIVQAQGSYISKCDVGQKSVILGYMALLSKYKILVDLAHFHGLAEILITHHRTVKICKQKYFNTNDKRLTISKIELLYSI